MDSGLWAGTFTPFTKRDSSRICTVEGWPDSLATTNVTLSGFRVLIGGCGWFWFCGICALRSGPPPISLGCTITWLPVMVTLTLRETCGRCSLAWRDSPQPISSAAPPRRPTSAAVRHLEDRLPDLIGAESNRRGGRQPRP